MIQGKRKPFLFLYEIQAKPGRADEFAQAFLEWDSSPANIMHHTEGQVKEGVLYRSEDDPEKFLLLGIWDHRSNHQEALKKLKAMRPAFMDLTESDWTPKYFEIVGPLDDILPPFEEYASELTAGLSEPHRNLAAHPIIAKLHRGELSTMQLIGWMRQIYWQTTEITRLIGLMYGECPIPEVRRMLFENLYEEEVGGASGTAGHFELARHFCLKLGISREDLEALPVLPETKAVVYLAESAIRHNWVAALGAFLAFESQSPKAFARFAEALREGYGLDDDTLQFFLVHIAADEDHGAVVLDLIKQYATTPALRQAIKEVAFEYAERYCAMLSTYEAFASQRPSGSGA